MEVIYISIRWTPALYRAVKARAERDGTSVNETVRRLTAEALGIKEDEKPKGRK